MHQKKLWQIFDEIHHRPKIVYKYSEMHQEEALPASKQTPGVKSQQSSGGIIRNLL